jgi:hypothetical protein
MTPNTRNRLTFRRRPGRVTIARDAFAHLCKDCGIASFAVGMPAAGRPRPTSDPRLLPEFVKQELEGFAGCLCE